MKELLEKLQKRFDELCQTGKLFRSSVSGEQVWEAYYNAFPKEFNQVLNTQPEHDCNSCKSFMRHYGNIIAFDTDYKIMSMWDLDNVNEEYAASVKAASDLLSSNSVGGFFMETFDFLYQAPYEKCTKQSETFKLGYSPSHVQYNGSPTVAVNADPNKIYEYNHLTVRIPNAFIYKGSESKGAVLGEKESARAVFYRGLVEQCRETVELVADLINQGSILNGTTYLHKVEKFLKHKIKFDQLSDANKLIYSFTDIDDSARFNNELIGVLCKEIETDGLETAILAWNKRVDPANYKMATAPVTKAQIESAKKMITELGYEESFNRRCATIDDILASEILHINENNAEKVVSIFDTISPSTSNKSVLTKETIEKLPDTGIEDFMKNILPTSSSVEVYVENAHKGNFATLTTSVNKESKKMFNWGNNFGLTFNGNLAGKSAIKEAVKSRGGNVTGELCIRLHFPNTTSDYDLHCRSSREHIYFGHCKGRRSTISSGMLDLDAQGMDGNFPPERRVENISFEEINKIPANSEYTIYVHNYSKRDNKFGFELEIENAITGEILKFDYNHFINVGDSVNVLKFWKDNQGNLTIKPYLDVSDSCMNSMEIYGIETNQFHPVNLVCKSPNYWGDGKIGNLNYLFMIPGCKAPDKISTFHTDNLNSELTKHRKVIQMLSYSLRTESTDNQLSGIGFNPTMEDERLVVKAAGKLYKLTFKN